MNDSPNPPPERPSVIRCLLFKMCNLGELFFLSWPIYSEVLVETSNLHKNWTRLNQNEIRREPKVPDNSQFTPDFEVKYRKKDNYRFIALREMFFRRCNLGSVPHEALVRGGGGFVVHKIQNLLSETFWESFNCQEDGFCLKLTGQEF